MSILDDCIAVLSGSSWHRLANSKAHIYDETTIVLLLEEVCNRVLLRDHALGHGRDPDGPVHSLLREQLTDFELVDVDLAK